MLAVRRSLLHKKECRWCGAELEAGQLFCRICGVNRFIRLQLWEMIGCGAFTGLSGLIIGSIILLGIPRIIVAPASQPSITVSSVIVGSAVTNTQPPTEKLTSTPTPKPSPTRFSPSLTPRPNNILQGHIVFTCYDDHDDELCLMNANGTGLTQLTNNSVQDFYASLSHDGKYIVFSRQISGSKHEIYRINVDGSTLKQLTDNNKENYAPTYSPDNTQIVFTSNQAGGKLQIWAMDSDGQNSHQLTSDGINEDPVWLPDGQHISFSSTRFDDTQIWIMRKDGSEFRKVTNVEGVSGRHSWSADGKILVFYAGKKKSRNIYTINIDGTNLRQLTNGGDDLAPSWSPYGGWITFTSYRDGNNEIYIMKDDGSSLLNLTQNASSEDYQPRWGP